MLIGKFNSAYDRKPKRKKNITGEIRYRPTYETAKKLIGHTPEVMVKITGYGRDPGNAVANLEYISRIDNNEVEDLALETDRGEILDTREAIRDFAKSWERDFGKPNKRRRDTAHLMLSMPPGTNPQAVESATRDFAWRTFAANHEYVFVLHTDEPHPHCHLTVKMLGRNGKRLDPNPDDLAKWREGFAQALREHGVDAAATPRALRGVVRKAENAVVKQIAENPRKGKQRVPKVTALRELDAIAELKAEALGQPVPEGPWMPNIRAQRDQARSAWLEMAEALEQPRHAVLLPEDHRERLASAQASASALQAGYMQRKVLDPRKAPPITSIKTASGLPTLTQVGAVDTGRRTAPPPQSITLLPEDHHAQLKRTQQAGAGYQLRLAAPREGEPPRQVTPLAALPRTTLAVHGTRLKWRQPLKTPTLTQMPTVASISAAVRTSSPLVFNQEIPHERPSPTRQAAALYQSGLGTPHHWPSRTVPSLRDLPRLDVVRDAAPNRRRPVEVLLQQDARHLMGREPAAGDGLRRAGTGPGGDHGRGSRQAASPDREGRTQGRAGSRESRALEGARGTQGGTGSAQGGSRGTEAREGGRPEGFDQARQGSGTTAGIRTYRAIGTVASILNLPEATGQGPSPRELAQQIRAFVAGMPAIETQQDVLKRELKARFKAKAPIQQAGTMAQPNGQEKGADQAAPQEQGKGLGL